MINTLNDWAASILEVAWPMLWQSSVLIVLLFVLDLAVLRKTRAAVRYGLWMVVLIKLTLPPSLALPTSPAWWLRVKAASAQAEPAKPTLIVRQNSGIMMSPPPDQLPATRLLTTTPEPKLSRTAWALLAVTFVSLGLLTWTMLRWRQIIRRGKKARPAPASLHEMSTATRSHAKLEQPVRIKVIDELVSPALYGLFRPTIIIPGTLLTQLSSGQLQTVLLHELFHLKRRDVWVNLVQTLLQIVYWWHPLLWLANARIKRLREEAVDDCVMMALRDEADTYAPTLFEIARLTFQRPFASLGLLGIVESKRSLRRRIEHLVNFTKPKHAGLTFPTLLGLLAFSVLAVPMGEAPERPQPLGSAHPAPNLWTNRTSSTNQIDLAAQFFSIDEATLLAFLPVLAQSSALVLNSNELAALETRLNQTPAPPVLEFDPSHFQQFSGGRFHYRIGGGTNYLANYQTYDRNGLPDITGAEIQIGTGEIEWTPLEFTVIPWTQDGVIRCQMELVSSRKPDLVEHAEALVPPGGAILWVVWDVPASKTCQFILLKRGSRKSAPMESNATEIPSPVQSASTDLLPLKLWLEKHNAKEATVAPSNSNSSASSVAVGSSPQEQSEWIIKPLSDQGWVETPIGPGLIIASNGVVVRYGGATLTAEAIELDQESGEALARGHVRVQREDRVWESDYLRYNFKTHEMKSAKLALPESPHAQKEGAQESVPLIVSIDAEGNLQLGAGPDSKRLTLEDLKAQLISKAEKNPQFKLAIRADEKAPFGRIIKVMDAAKDAKINIVNAFTDRALKDSAGEPLFVRTFKIDPAIVSDNLRDLDQPKHEEDTGASAIDRMLHSLRAHFAGLGVHFDPPKSIYYKDLEGTLVIRATAKELETTERALQQLNIGPPQVNVKVSFVEMGDDAFTQLLTNLKALAEITTTTNQAPKDLVQGTVPNEIASLDTFQSATNSLERVVTSILPDSQFRLLIRALEQKDGTDLLSMSSVTTLSGRQTQIQNVDLRTVVTNWTPQTPGTGTNLYQTRKVPVGSILDLTPVVAADGFSIGLRIVGTHTEFLGYDDPGSTLGLPFPHFRSRQVTASAQVRDGETLMLMGVSAEPDIKRTRKKTPVLGDIPLLGPLFRSESTVTSKKHLLIFVTPTLINPAGNPLHPENRPGSK